MKKSWCSILFIISLVLMQFSCGEDPIPKPKGMFRLSYPKPKYQKIDLDCPYIFEKNDIAVFHTAEKQKPCWYNLEYPKLQATLYLSYFPVDHNLDSLFIDAQNLTQEHVVKADEIIQEPYINEETKVYGMLYTVSGNAASQAQFYVTDSTRHFVSGSVYFKIRPNYDSILPAAHYIQNDVRHFMESIRWKSRLMH